MEDTRALVQRQFGTHAENYVASLDHAQGESLDELVTRLPLESSWRVLDVATGGGHTALALAAHVGQVLASDLTVPMLQAARRLAARRGIANLAYPAADAGTLPFADSVFDLLTCRLAAHHFPDCAAFAHEAARVLRPGGWFGLIDNITPPEGRPARFVNAFEKLRDPSHHWEYAAADWEAFCRAAGLEPRVQVLYRKPLEFEPWCDRLSVPAATRLQLRTLLHHIPAACQPALQPTLAGDPATGRFTFSLGELLLLAQKPTKS